MTYAADYKDVTPPGNFDQPGWWNNNPAFQMYDVGTSSNTYFNHFCGVAALWDEGYIPSKYTTSGGVQYSDYKFMLCPAKYDNNLNGNHDDDHEHGG